MANNRGTQEVLIPARTWTHCTQLNWEVVRDRDRTIFRGFARPGILKTLEIHDSCELLRRFLSLDTDDDDSVLDFLREHGEFKAPFEVPEIQGRSATTKDRGKVIIDEMERSSLVSIQGYLMDMLLSGDATLTPSRKHGDVGGYRVFFRKTRAGSQVQIEVSGVFPSLLATVQFKLAQGAKFKICAREDCGLPFEITSRHKRRFCSQYCAHITSLRKRRRKQKAARRKEK